VRGREDVRNGTAMTLTAGDYHLVVEGRYYASQAGEFDYTLNLRAITRSAPVAIGLDEEIAGQLATPFDRHSYEFTLAEERLVVLDALADGPYTRIEIDGPGGFYYSNTQRALDGPYQTATPPIRLLPAGDYQVRISSERIDREPDYRFILRDLAAGATAIGLDEAVSGTLDPATETDIYQFDAAAGQVVALTGVTNTGGSYNAYYRIIDPFGRNLINSTYLQGRDPFTLPYAGTYTLLMETYAQEDPTRTTTYGFTLQDPSDPAAQAIGIGERVEGSIDRIGQRHRFTLEITEETQLYLDSLTNDYYAHVLVQGPSGTNRDYRMRDADSYDNTGDVSIRMTPGSYDITVYIEGQRTGDFAFALRDYAAEAVPIAIGEPVAGVLDPKRSTNFYAIDATAGEAFLVDVNSVSGSSQGVYWRLVDPNGDNELTRQSLADRDTHSFKRSGRYYLFIEGRTREGDGSISYDFSLEQVALQTFAADLDAVAPHSGMSVVEGRNGPAGPTALAFTGFERIEIDSPLTQNDGDLSVSLWFKPDQMAVDWMALVQKSDPDLQYEREYGLYVHRNGYLHTTKSYSSGSQNTANTPSGSVVFDAWNHAVAVWDRTNGQIRTYLNGVLAATSGISANAASGDGVLSLGQGFQGAITEVKYWDAALTDEDALAAYDGSDGAIPADKLIELPLDEGEIGDQVTAVAETGPNAITPAVIDASDGLQGLFSGRLDTSGEVDVYHFSLDQERLLYWDTLSYQQNITATLRGPGGVSISRELRDGGDDNYDDNYAFIAPAGDYSLTFDGASTRKGAYSLRLLDLGQAEPIVADGSLVEGSTGTLREANGVPLRRHRRRPDLRRHAAARRRHQRRALADHRPLRPSGLWCRQCVRHRRPDLGAYRDLYPDLGGQPPELPPRGPELPLLDQPHLRCADPDRSIRCGQPGRRGACDRWSHRRRIGPARHGLPGDRRRYRRRRHRQCHAGGLGQARPLQR
jgi:hypothetical protein